MPAIYAPYAYFSLTPAAATIGAYISGVDLNTQLDEAVITDLRRALLEWKVLFFRDQDISEQKHRQFAELWGTLEGHPFDETLNTDAYPGGSKPVVEVTRGVTDAQMPGNNNNWHNDLSFAPKPSFGAVLRAVEIPDIGGDTLWADTVIAYDTLPVTVKNKINRLSAEHDWIESVGYLLPPEKVAQLRAVYPPTHHPVVRRIPETGRLALFVNPVYTAAIVELSRAESAELLSLLYRHISRPEFQVRLTWEKNTIAIWDNRSCQHYAINDYFPNARIMDRVSITGEEPCGIG